MENFNLAFRRPTAVLFGHRDVDHCEFPLLLPQHSRRVAACHRIVRRFSSLVSELDRNPEVAMHLAVPHDAAAALNFCIPRSSTSVHPSSDRGGGISF